MVVQGMTNAYYVGTAGTVTVHGGEYVRHRILPSGLVEPSVKCPLCDFHETVSLTQWSWKK